VHLAQVDAYGPVTPSAFENAARCVAQVTDESTVCCLS
jgi:hypothetical protein